MLKVVTHAGAQGQVAGCGKMVFREGSEFVSRKVRSRIAKRLPVLVGRAAEKCRQRGKNVDSPKTVADIQVLSNAVGVRSQLQQVPPALHAGNIVDLVMVLPPVAVAGVGPAKLNQARDINSRARLVCG